MTYTLDRLHPKSLALVARTCDVTYATVVSENGAYAAYFWARSGTYGHPLTLIDYAAGQLLPPVWAELSERLSALTAEFHARYGSLGAWVETEALTAQAQIRGLRVARVIPPHLRTPAAWNSLVVGATHYLRDQQVAKLGSVAPRLPADVQNFRGGPRGEKPDLPAFLYGIALGLDPAAADKPDPERVVMVGA